MYGVAIFAINLAISMLCQKIGLASPFLHSDDTTHEVYKLVKEIVQQPYFC